MGCPAFGTPEGTRTPDLLIRSQSLYPTELLAHTFAERLDIVAQGNRIVKQFLPESGKLFLFVQKHPGGPGAQEQGGGQDGEEGASAGGFLGLGRGLGRLGGGLAFGGLTGAAGLL